MSKKVQHQKSNESFTQLATRIPTKLHLAMKMGCVKKEVSIMEFVVAAIEKHLKK